MFRKAFASNDLVLIERNQLEASPSIGYLVGFSEELLLLQLIDDGIRYHGFQIIRIEDVTAMECPAPHQEFIQDAIELRKLDRPAVPDIDLTNMGMALATLKREVPLITVFLELDEPDACYIGKIDTISHDQLAMYYIDPDANFDDEPSDYLLHEITRVDFGGGYAEALHLVATARPDGGTSGVLH